jgi:predicted lipoprotein
VTRSEVLAAIGVCATALYRDFRVAADELKAATQTAAATPDLEHREAAREAWLKAIGVWEQAELMRVGPAGPVTLPGGQGLRDSIYSWPLVSRCLVEQTIVAKSYESPTFPKSALINVRGLAAAEYLLFYEGTDNACSASASINTMGTWAALGADELKTRKAAYAAVVAADVAERALLLEQAWDPKAGNFTASLAGAGGAGSPFESVSLALNAVSDGIFYIEKEVKDLKLGRPLGLVDCPAASCPEAVEAPYAKRSRDHIRNNIEGFRRVFEGCDEAALGGFDDLLTSMGAGDVASRMKSDIASALAAADAVGHPDIATALATDQPSVAALHGAVKEITDALKTEFVTVLDLEIPKVVEGDND